MSVYKRGGVYWYDFRFRGILYRDSSGFSNKQAATDVEAIRRAELAEGGAGIVRSEPIPKYADLVNNDFLPWSKMQQETHPPTYLRYTVSCNRLMMSFGKLPLDAITTSRVERFKMERSEEVTSAGTNRDLAVLRSMLNYALRKSLIIRNPVHGVKLLPEDPGAMRVVSQEEQRKYMTKANQSLRDVATVILETGLRPEERLRFAKRTSG